MAVERKVIYGDYLENWSCRAYKPTWSSNWLYTVKFGDTGYEVDEGIYNELLEKVIPLMEEYTQHMQNMLAALKKIQEEETSGP